MLFLATIQILQGNVFNLYGKQQNFLAYSIFAVAVSIALTATAILAFHSIWLVAAMQVTALGGWWLFNAFALRPLSGESLTDLARVFVGSAWSAVSLKLAFSWSSNCRFAAHITGSWPVPLVFFFGSEIRLSESLQAGRGRLA